MEWLLCDNVDILVKFLQEDAAHLGVSMHFLGCYQFQYLANLNSKAPSNESYHCISSPNIWKLEEHLLNGCTQYVDSIHNIEVVHWIAFVVDGHQREI